MKGFVLKLGILAVLGGAGYVLLSEDVNSRYDFPFFEEKLLDKKEEAIQIVDDVKEKGVDESIAHVAMPVVDLGKTAISKIGEGIESLVSKAKTKTFETFKELVNKEIDDAGESIGVTGVSISGGGGLSPVSTSVNSPVIFTVRVGTPTYFTVQNKEKGEILYEIDWQDGKIDSDTLKSEGSRVLSHSWSKIGDYIIRFKIITKNGQTNYPVVISVF